MPGSRHFYGFSQGSLITVPLKFVIKIIVNLKMYFSGLLLVLTMCVFTTSAPIERIRKDTSTTYLQLRHSAPALSPQVCEGKAQKNKKEREKKEKSHSTRNVAGTWCGQRGIQMGGEGMQKALSHCN